MSDYTVLQPVHLGKGVIGSARKEALERLAANNDCFWGGQPSIGRYLIKLADEEINMKLEKMFPKGRVVEVPHPYKTPPVYESAEVVNHTVDGQRVNGIIVKFDDGNILEIGEGYLGDVGLM